MLHPWPAALPSPALATQALGRKSLGNHVSQGGPVAAKPAAFPVPQPFPGQSAPHCPVETQADLAGRTKPHIPIFLAINPPPTHPPGLIPQGSGFILSLVAESIAGLEE